MLLPEYHDTVHFLDTGLEELHKETIAFQRELDFSRDEMEFFFKLISSVKSTVVPIKVQNHTWHVEKELAVLCSRQLPVLRADIRQDEKLFNALIRNLTGDEKQYRQNHAKLSEKIGAFRQSERELKKEIFGLVETINGQQANGNGITKVIFERRAVRKYKDKPVTRALIRKILESGMMAPSATNSQPWKFYVLMKKETISMFSRAIALEAFRENESLLQGLHFPDGDGLNRMADMIFYHAPVVVFITSPKNDPWAETTIGMCTQNILLAAKSLGLESCPVGFGKYVEQSSVYHLLDIPDTEQVNISVIIGYGDEEPRMRPRKTGNVFFID